MKKIISLFLVVCLCAFALISCEKKPDVEEESSEGEAVIAEVELKTSVKIPEDFKFGLICLHDENSTYDLNFISALKRLQTALGLTDEQIIIKKNIPEGNECYEAAKDLADAGCKIVFADSFGHESYILQAAKDYPDVQFCHATGTMAHTEGLDNFHNAFASIYEGRYLAGIVAGLKLNEMRSEGKLKGDTPVMGYVGAFTYAEVISGYTSFYLGAKSVCPDVTMLVQFTGSWYDEVQEKAAAETLIAAGCDLISQHADSMGAPTACEDAGVPNVTYNGSTFEACEETYLISSRIDWAPYYLFVTECICRGDAIPADWTGTIDTGSVLLTGLNTAKVADGTAEALEKAIAEFKAGTLNVFATDTFTVGGVTLTDYLADVDTDAAYTADTQVIVDGYFAESTFRSAPYFDLKIDGITLMNAAY